MSSFIIQHQLGGHSSAQTISTPREAPNEDFTLTEYDDVVVRQLIERVTVESKDTITVRFKGGFEVRKELENDN